MDRRIVVFDQEIYNQFRYKTPRPYFHTFEADDGQVGLNFADETEAEYFHRVTFMPCEFLINFLSLKQHAILSKIKSLCVDKFSSCRLFSP